MNTNDNFIAVDWGSSNFRAYHIKGDECVDTIESDKGMKFVEKSAFESTLNTLLQDWMPTIVKHELPIIMGGMVGSAQGWIDAGYQPLPLSLDELRKGICTVENQLGVKIYIKPGVSMNTQGIANVMRGEEIQLLGACHTDYDCFVFPGTHSKWLALTNQNSQLSSFHTVMTGELFSVLMHHSLLGVGTKYDFNESAFTQGVKVAKEGQKDIIEQLFYARAARVLGQLAPDEVEAWLSGLLIGHEIKSQLVHFPSAKNIAIIASSGLGQHYLTAFKQFDLHPQLLNGTETTMNGFRSIYHGLKH